MVVKEFSLDEYQVWLLNNIEYKPLNSVLDKYINAISQWNVTPYKYLNRSNSQSVNKYLNNLFKTLLVKKPKSVSINDYLLYKFGYKHCTNCNQVLLITEYSSCKSRWNNLYMTCKVCKKQYFIANKQQINNRNKQYNKENKDKINNNTAKYRASKVNATPNWLTKEQNNEIQNKYTESKKLTEQTGILHHVDHIIPLQGENISGLHVPWNLQVVTAKENLQKGNKLLL
jgi:hypothetical protein